jgi:hypothetical protein
MVAGGHLQHGVLRPVRMASIYSPGSLVRKTPQVGGADRRVSAHGVRRARACSNSRDTVIFLLRHARRAATLDMFAQK